MTLGSFINGFLLGWSVAWPPGPVNGEMIRRGLLPKNRGGGFWFAWSIGLGACAGDFLWAFAVSVGAGAFLNVIGVRRSLAMISFCLLLFLATTFARRAYQIFRSHRADVVEKPEMGRHGGFVLGFFFVMSSPFNISFWLAVIGGQAAQTTTVSQSLLFGITVVLGALVWTVVLCLAVKFGARIFSHPAWQIATQGLTALVMLFFAVRLVLQFP
jgi:threonine/homoserine/homoserine lactone efflux protein